MTDESGKKSKDREQRDNARATVAETPDSDPRDDAGGDGESSGGDGGED